MGSIQRNISAALFLIFSFSGLVCDAYSFPWNSVQTYPDGGELTVKVNSLNSIVTELPFSYYSLPYCQPPYGPNMSVENMGEMFLGDMVETSPFLFHMNRNESFYLCTTKPLNEQEVRTLKQRIDDLYQVNMILDKLHAMRYTIRFRSIIKWFGFPVGFKSGWGQSYKIINHLKFKVLIHAYEDEGMGVVIEEETSKKRSRFEVVGFEAVPCSVEQNLASMSRYKMYDAIPSVQCEQYRYQGIKEQEQVSFTYEVNFVKTDLKWHSRWDAYLETGDTWVHWFCILNSLIVVLFLAGFVFVKILRTVGRELRKYEELDREAQLQMTKELSGWKLLVGDVFRAPNYSKLLCAMVGNGVQITGMAFVTTIFALLGFISPATRGTLLTVVILLYSFFGIAGGYVAIRMWRAIQGDSVGWMFVAWLAACLYPGIVILIFTILNFVLWHNQSTGAIPISVYFILLSLWFCTDLPLTLLGGFMGIRAEVIKYPVKINKIPREIPARKYRSWFLVIRAGILPYGTLVIELFYVMRSIWMSRFYSSFGFLFVVLVLLVIVCGEISIVVTYLHLCVEDWKWWWKSFFGAGSVALYVFLYSVNYLVSDLYNLNGPASVVLYLGYSLIMVLAIMLSTGAIGFLTSFYFVGYLFSSIE